MQGQKKKIETTTTQSTPEYTPSALSSWALSLGCTQNFDSWDTAFTLSHEET